MREAPRRRRLADVVAAFVVDCRARRLSPKTISSYLEAVASFRASLEAEAAEQTLADLTLDAGRSWAAGLTVGRRPATVANRVRSLKVLSHIGLGLRLTRLSSGGIRSSVTPAGVSNPVAPPWLSSSPRSMNQWISLGATPKSC